MFADHKKVGASLAVLAPTSQVICLLVWLVLQNVSGLAIQLAAYCLEC